jgi:hypothetical protein
LGDAGREVEEEGAVVREQSTIATSWNRRGGGDGDSGLGDVGGDQHQPGDAVPGALLGVPQEPAECRGLQHAPDGAGAPEGHSAGALLPGQSPAVARVADARMEPLGGRYPRVRRPGRRRLPAHLQVLVSPISPTQ